MGAILDKFFWGTPFLREALYPGLKRRTDFFPHANLLLAKLSVMTKLLSGHELSYIRRNTYNATDAKEWLDWRITYHSSAGFISVDETVFGQEPFLIEKNSDTGWIFQT